ncbi:potassium voltage-gated channel subfamily S member 3-like [Sinocyclocheilus rhinocerous]|uniref:Potassium voltage-gated channel subfamily S member 3-like n=1 Tax=Sinocyclocheilus rhinocerous TaxID=307959 RepID=A0A673HEU7_9TELE|nr:PREDICTED: potassium voltage-gated channel subfamily S member 3-like [Sinocyclocheilus rhinocerous]XP_016373151.1 PREDICTED: potassium voltage-gated channel subfamily S member 3-like [Sinocyclocheilus rhinocerous]XP_016373152.1 PREDICTED: potassium voltage-gated channel subfamily S member 3-like [Sinocyclocheilus rhinocerous]XP_016373153.1 PREDICTED: potassium voltage-gated channel subfamily S member 3-like [Sinocyclocheilus rhinocerous]
MMYGQVLHHQGREEDLVNLNVGGIQHKVERCVLLRFPNTRVGQLIQCCSDAAILELCDDYSPAEQEYYFDRSPQVFHCVLNFYRTGHFHALEELCVFCFSQEIEYWGIGELDLEACCLDWFLERKHDREQNACGRSSNATSSGEISVVGSDLWRFEGTWCSDVRKFMWQTLEDPNHSKCSKGVAVLSVLVILTSIVAMCIHSMPEFRYATDSEHSVLDSLELICNIFFSVEFVLRVVAAPRPWTFLGNPLNMIDMASVLPFYVTLAFESLDEGDGEENQSLVNMGKVVQVLRLMRAFRVLKLARHSEGVRAFGETLKNCQSEVGLLILFITVGISFFSTFIYYTEKEDASSKLSSIPVCWWWAIISMTTVGYGDVYPQTAAGRIVATLCILCGLLVVSLPITIIMNNFSKYFEKNTAKRRLSVAKT